MIPQVEHGGRPVVGLSCLSEACSDADSLSSEQECKLIYSHSAEN